MPYPVKCPCCGSDHAEWRGCMGCGDDIGTLVCPCGAVITGVMLGELSALETASRKQGDPGSAAEPSLNDRNRTVV